MYPFKSSVYLLFCLFTAAFASGEIDWPQFRGPQGNGNANADRVPTELNPSENLKWKTLLPGKGWSSPVFDSNSIWLTAAVELVPTEEEKNKLLAEAGEDEKKFKVRQIAKSIRLLALEVDLDTGSLRREIELTIIRSPDSIHSLNSYASPTPFLEEGRLYAHFGTYGTYCVDTSTGETIWEARLPLEHSVGPGSSPFVHKDLIILICDGVDQQYVTALDKNTGKEVWKSDRPEIRSPDGERRKAYSTPIAIAGPDKTTQLICMGAQWLVSYDPSSGKENWKLDHGSGFSVVPRPVFNEKEELIYISTGFGKPELWAISPAGEVVWKDPKRIPAKPSPLLVEEELYIITDGGVASCFNAKDGERYWTERVGGNYSASPLYAGGHIYLCNHEGEVIVLKPGKEFEIVSKSNLDEQLMASPVARDGELILRSVDALYCFQ